jgi:hypothetical protein
MTYLATGFRDADAEADVGKLVDCLEFLDDLPCFRAYKERSIDALCLTKAARAIDLCCGLGRDLLRMRRRAPPRRAGRPGPQRVPSVGRGEGTGGREGRHARGGRRAGDGPAGRAL